MPYLSHKTNGYVDKCCFETGLAEDILVLLASIFKCLRIFFFLTHIEVIVSETHQHPSDTKR